MTSDRPLILRCDADGSIGTGHVMRCWALAQAWQDAGGSTVFVIATCPPTLQARLSSSGCALFRIAGTPGSSVDAAATVRRARQLNADWVVVDGDCFQSHFLEHIRSAGVRLLLIDDFADRERFPADLILNPNFCADAEVYRKAGSPAAVLTGPRYALLRREFQGTRERQPGEKGNRVLITPGGSDPDNLTLRIATALGKCVDLQLTVVAGAEYPHPEELQQLQSANLKVVVDAHDMAELMKRADLAIIAAGGTLWEMLSMGCVVLSYSRNTVQRRVIRSLADEGVVVEMGDTSQFDPNHLVSAVRHLAESSSARERMARLGRALVDGRGASRVVQALRQAGAR
jgi:UDP-2,4-diacetamido-2,4,6-trideoxy-beta-L-altropyranose hydrolase